MIGSIARIPCRLGGDAGASPSSEARPIPTVTTEFAVPEGLRIPGVAPVESHDQAVVKVLVIEISALENTVTNGAGGANFVAGAVLPTDG